MGVVGSNENPVDHSHTRLWIGQCGDDHQLIGVGNDGAFEGVCVIG